MLQYYGGEICCSTTAEFFCCSTTEKDDFSILKWGKQKPKYDVVRVSKKIAGEKCECVLCVCVCVGGGGGGAHEEDIFCRKHSCIIVSL